MPDFPEERSSERRGNVYLFPENSSLLPDSLTEKSVAGIPESPPPVHPARQDKRLKSAVALLSQDLKRHWTVESLAGEVGLSPERLRQLFKQQLATSPMHYLKELRLVRARYLLLTTFQQISEIAAAVGYGESNHHFTTHFREKFGECPTRYRRTEGLVPAEHLPAV